MEIPGKGMNTSLVLCIKRSNKKQKASFYITDITNQDFRQLLKNFDNSLYVGYKSKQVHNEPTQAYFFLIKQITNLMKSERHFLIRTKFVKSGANETIVHVNIAIQSVELQQKQRKDYVHRQIYTNIKSRLY